MSKTTSDQNGNTFSGDFQSQHQWLGNIFNTNGDTHINPSLIVQEFNVNFSSGSTASDSSDDNTHATERNSVGALSLAYNSCYGNRDVPASSGLRTHAQVPVSDHTCSVPDTLASLDSAIRKARESGHTDSVRPLLGKPTAEQSHQQSGEAEANRHIARLWRGIPALVSCISGKQFVSVRSSAPANDLPYSGKKQQTL